METLETSTECRLYESIGSMIDRGHSGAYSLAYEMKDEILCFRSGDNFIPVKECIISLTSSIGQKLILSDQDFKGQLLIDNLGEKPSKVRLVYLDENGTEYLSTEKGKLNGFILAVAKFNNMDNETRYFGLHAVFVSDGETSKSSYFRDSMKEMVKHWTIDIQHLRKVLNGINTI
jgi:hypothetical protein